MSSSNTNGGKYSAQLSSAIKSKPLSNINKQFLRVAMADPNVEQIVGVPDDVADATVTKKIMVERVINMADYAGSNGTQLDIILWDTLRAEQLTRVIAYREAEIGIGDSNHVFVGGVGIYVQSEDKSAFNLENGDANWEAPLNSGNNTSFRGDTINIPDEYLGGRCRLLGVAVKAVNEGAATYQSGTVRAWEQPVEGSDTFYINIAQSLRSYDTNESGSDWAVIKAIAPAEQLPPPPTRNSEILALRRTKLVGKSEEGVFIIGAPELGDGQGTMLPTMKSRVYENAPVLASGNTGNNNGFYDFVTQSTRNILVKGLPYYNMNNNPSNVPAVLGNNQVGMCLRNYHTGGGLRGVRFSGLNNGSSGNPGPAVIRIQATFYIEQIPSQSDVNMLALAKPSPPASPETLAMLQHLRATMDFAYPAKYNGLGTFTKLLTNALSTKVPENKFTRAYDKHVSKPAAKALLKSDYVKLLPGGTIGQATAQYANAVHRGGKAKAEKKYLAAAVAKEAIPMALAAASAITNKVRAANYSHDGNSLKGPDNVLESIQREWNNVGKDRTAQQNKKLLVRAYAYHTAHPSYRFPVKLWQQIQELQAQVQTHNVTSPNGNAKPLKRKRD